MNLSVIRCEVGFMPTNAYVVRDTESGDSLVVDPGFYDPALTEALQKLGINRLRYILLTHGHYDHILGVQQLKDHYGGDVVIYESEAAFLKDDSLSLVKPFCNGIPMIRAADRPVRDGDRLPFGDGEITVLHTPGHTSGSVCYLLGDLLLTGDTLFCESVGRADLPTGDDRALLRSVRRLAALGGDYKVLPGHMETSTLAYERANNPYLE
ncbi:MAG: MBL fold metallo-hydrolase [Clostridia bacterium]|nr:MBL fold metallo-hydrolase [Clostridia bacterium]